MWTFLLRLLGKRRNYTQFSESDILMGRDLEFPLTEEMRANLTKLTKQVNLLLAEYGKIVELSSGYRPGKYNLMAGGAPNSPHKTCQAIDIKDEDKALYRYFESNQALLEKFDLYMEDGRVTKTWCHLQTRPTKSGRRIFIP